MDSINGYPAAILRERLFDRLGDYTASSIARRLREAEARLVAQPAAIPIAFGEDCGPGVKLREAGRAVLGGGFFDNLVAPIDSAIRLLDEDFAHLLALRNLLVGRWEGHDSVLDSRYSLFFHHHFHVRGEHLEKSATDGSGDGSGRRRLIEEADIPLFLPSVLAQFEYLAAKLRLVLRAPQPKILVLRRFGGAPVPLALTFRLGQALERFGARRTELRVVHSLPLPPGEACDESLHRFIPEGGERWGPAEAWRSLA